MEKNQRGFVLAETLVISVFLVILFTMIYSHFYPLIGEYEKREEYDTVDGKYTIFWLKRMIESTSYTIYNEQGTDSRRDFFFNKGYLRFECKDLVDDDSQAYCKDLVNSLQINRCDANGNGCDIFITAYQLGSPSGNHVNQCFQDSNNAFSGTCFKNTVKTNLKRYEEICSSAACRQTYITNCQNTYGNSVNCTNEADKKVFNSGFYDYIISLPDYVRKSTTGASYRVTAIIHHTKDNNNYYSYATMEVNK